jgi:hypothetical protein
MDSPLQVAGAHMLTALQTLPRDAELLAFEAGCEDYGEREVDEVEWQGGPVSCSWAPAATTHREARRWGRCLGSVAVGGPRRPRSGSGGRWAPAKTAPGYWLGTVGRAGLAVLGDHPEAAARQRGEGFGVVGRSWHGGRIRKGDGGGETGGAVPVSRSGQGRPV